ncbi:MAG: DUF2752 domain-containing protein [Ruminococcaceae bacterium]|nr:DUF2752 domain-containing protein [Oscillospiraceae bacterium]
MNIKPKTKTLIIKYLSIIGAITLYIVLMNIIFGSSCLIKNLIHFPCPFCGMTRAHIAALNLDFITALRYHPMFFIGLPFLALVLFEENFTGKLKKISNITVITIGLLFILIYIIRLICGDPYLFN